jgi:hypothetical protein
MALGFFVIHIAGKRYGVKSWDATMLANPFDEVRKRLTMRGSHHPAFPMDSDAADIAYSFRRSFYGKCEEDEVFFGLTVRHFKDIVRSNRVDWTAYCDEAFDDGSYVLQFEEQNIVRLVAFSSTPDFLYDPESLREVSLSPDEFYRILQEWHDRFYEEWSTAPHMTGPIQRLKPV